MHLQKSMTVRSTCSSRWLICVRSQRNWIASPKTKTYTARSSSVSLPAARKRSRAAVLSVALSALFCRSTTDLARAALGSSGWPFHIHVQRPEVAAALFRLVLFYPGFSLLTINAALISIDHAFPERNILLICQRECNAVFLFCFFICTSKIPNRTCDRSWRI